MFQHKLVTCSLLILLWFMMVFKEQGFLQEFEAANGEGEILTRTIHNATNHVYPYMATVLTLSCLLIMVMAIICFGETLG